MIRNATFWLGSQPPGSLLLLKFSTMRTCNNRTLRPHQGLFTLAQIGTWFGHVPKLDFRFFEREEGKGCAGVFATIVSAKQSKNIAQCPILNI